MTRRLVWLLFLGCLFLSLLTDAFAGKKKVVKPHARTHQSCDLRYVFPYRYPLTRPAPPTRKPIQPNWGPPSTKAPMMRGISLGTYFTNQTYDYDRFLKDIARTGASHVGLIFPWYQLNVRSSRIERHKKRTVSDARLIRTIRQARARGLQVFLLPIVRLKKRGPDDWRGVIKPKNLDAWWTNYRNYILHYARLSREHGVEVLSVGSELVSMEGYRKRWTQLIQAVRAIFPGRLIYSANWDHYEPVTYWDKLDYIGISSYYELSKKKVVPLKTLADAWEKVRLKVEKWKKKYPKQPLVFTEVGYYSQIGTHIYPWDYTRTKALSLEAQRLTYTAFINTWRRSKVLKGLYFWNWFGRGGPKDKGYTPRGKPAECVLRQWYYERKRLEGPRPAYKRQKQPGEDLVCR